METPICDFVRQYAASGAIRAHMPGHKGRGPAEAIWKVSGERNPAAKYEAALSDVFPFDITEIEDADDLYHAQSIIAESEANASSLFGCPTYYSTEGSSLCIRAMIYLCMMKQAEDAFDARKALSAGASASSGEKPSSGEPASSDEPVQSEKASTSGEKPARTPWILATRNAHKAFLSSCILLNLENEWIKPTGKAGTIRTEDVTEAIMAGISKYGTLPCCVYVTSPDYTGEDQPLKDIVKAAHWRGVPVAVDNAHGAYQFFIEGICDPIEAGADICCDSAHKTLPVLTGGAYLHIRKGFRIGSEETEAKRVKEAMALFASTSPSWLILQSLDLANKVLSKGWAYMLKETCSEVERLKGDLMRNGIELLGYEPMKITISTRPWGFTGHEFAARLREGDAPDHDPKRKRSKRPLEVELSETEGGSAKRPIEVEFSDPDMVVLMISPSNTIGEIHAMADRILSIPRHKKLPDPEYGFASVRGVADFPERVMNMREASMRPGEYVPVEEAAGRVAHLMDVACPPAIPIVMPGERIGKKEIEIMRYYGYSECKVVRE